MDLVEGCGKLTSDEALALSEPSRGATGGLLVANGNV